MVPIGELCLELLAVMSSAIGAAEHFSNSSLSPLNMQFQTIILVLQDAFGSFQKSVNLACALTLSVVNERKFAIDLHKAKTLDDFY